MKKRSKEMGNSIIQFIHSSHESHVAEFGVLFVVNVMPDFGLKPFSIVVCRKATHKCQKAAIAYQSPARLDLNLIHIETGLFLEFAAEITDQVKLARRIDIRGFGCATRKIPLSS